MGLIPAKELRGAGPEARARVGGKGLGLARLHDLGCEVPAFFVVEPGDYSREELASALESLGGGPVAVRSSAVAEDGGQNSFAGQLESEVGVEGLDAVAEAIERCRASGSAERVRAYCAARGIEVGPVAVVVQRMARADAAAVAFTSDPQDPDSCLISAAWGFGEGVVQGSVPCDSFSVDAKGRVKADIAHKGTCLGPMGLEREVPAGDRDRPCLDEGMVQRIAELCRSVEARTGRPQDLELCVEGGRLLLLQMRPITVPIAKGRKLLWDNSNIVESYSGVTTPLTFSFASRAYTIIYQLFCAAMGVESSVIQENQAIFQRMIGLIRGRVYYNLNSWYGVLTLLPGYRFNRHFMETMMGVSEVAADEDAEAESAGWQRALRHGPKLLKMLGALGWRLWKLEDDIAGFKAVFEEAWRPWQTRSMKELDAFGLMDLYASLERKLLWAWTPPIINDFYVMIFYGLLKARCAAIMGDPKTNLHNELLAGEGELESTAPTREALAMAAELRGGPLHALFVGEATDAEVLRLARRDDAFEVAFAGYMLRWGDRCIDELKLERPSLVDRPEFLIAALRNYLRADAFDPATFGEEERKIRARAEAEVASRLSGPKAWLFSWILAQARRRVKTREDLRFARTRVFGLVRRIFRELGARLADAGALAEAQDVFYLTVDEIFGFVRGTSVTTELKALVALRRAEFAAFEAAPPPGERFHTRGVVYVANPFTTPAKNLVDADGRWQGTGVCPGRVEGPVRVLADPGGGARLDGEILVAERTDPGWVPLYPSISGLLVERGSLLSHSAVVAREMGIPTIVGLRGLSATLRDGQLVRMDGGAGTVEILE